MNYNIPNKLKWAAAIGIGLYVHDMIVKRIIKGEGAKGPPDLAQVPTVPAASPAPIPGSPGFVRPPPATRPAATPPAATRANTPSEPPPPEDADWQGPVKTW